jgi:hypothetical protein
MKSWSRFLFAAMLGVAATHTRAQTQVMTVSMTNVSVLSNTASTVAFIDITNPGSGYTTVPSVTFVGGGATVPATATANINLTGAISNINLSGAGAGYTSAPTIVISPPTTTNGVQAQANAYLGTTFVAPFQNESFGPAGIPIAMTALAVGTFPGGGFNYEFFVDGVSIGTAVSHPPAGTPASIGWAPPRPGSYFLTVKASDGPHEAISLPVRYFAVGTAITSPTPNTIVPRGSSVVIQATGMPQPLQGGTSNAFISRIDFLADGALIGSDTVAPYSMIYTPSDAPATHIIEARAYDNNGNQVSPNGTAQQNLTMVPPIGTPPTVVISSPANNAKIAIPGAGGSITVAVSAGSPNGLINKVELYIDGILFGTSTTFPYQFNWTPTVVGTYKLVALAYDDKNNVVATSTSTTATPNPAPTTITIAAPPTVTLVSPIAGATIGLNSPFAITAAATDSNIVGGGIAKVQFFDGSTFLGESTAPASGTNQYVFQWTPTAAGTSNLSALAINNLGISTASAPVSVTVSAGGGSGGGGPVGLPPVVSLTAPGNGAVVRINSSNLVSATATDPDGTIASVQFSVNNIPLGSAITTFPYRTTFTPTAEGIFRITATATDNNGNSTTTPAATVLVVSSTNTSDTVYTGIIVGSGESGTFTAVNVRGTMAAFIGQSSGTSGAKTYFFGALPLGGNGSFSGTAGGHTISGTFSETGAFGTLDSGVSFSGAVTFPGAIATVAPGYYTGNITGRPSSVVDAIVGPDGSIAVYISDGGFQAVGMGGVDATGTFTNIALNNSGARFSGKADPVTGFLSGTITGGPGGSIMAATSSGSSFSDGSLRNLSTRGQVGTGNNVLIAGFVVGGTSPKQVLIRAVGPTLSAAPYNLAGMIADPQLQVYDGQGNPVLGLSNNNWGGNAAIAAAASSVGAFSLPSSSLDAALLTTLVPGGYSVQVSGVNNGTGLALVEVYDVDSPTPFSSQKVLNISTRGNVGTGNNLLIAGFVINGGTSKKLLIRGVGPTLAAAPFRVPGVLNDPMLVLQRNVNGAWLTVRENDNWETGNDATLVADAAAKVGAFPLLTGSKDAVLLLNLPPGTYSAQLSGVSATTGIGLVEVYEIP